MAAATANTGPSYLPSFSQRGSTCGPDSLFTILFETDGIRDRFRPLLEGGVATNTTTPYKKALSLAVQRYRRMKAGPHAPPAFRTRRESRNEGEGSSVLNIISECDPTNIGMIPGKTKDVIRRIVSGGELGVPLADLIQVVSLPSVGDPAIDPARTIAILMEYDKYNAAHNVYTTFYWEDGVKQYEIDENVYEAKKDLRLQPERKHRTAGHIAAFLKREGIWYYADNEVGWLHKIKNQAFVESHLLPTLQSDVKSIALGWLREEEEEEEPTGPSLLFGIAAGDRVYTGASDLAEDLDVIDWSYDHFGAVEAHVFMIKEKAMGGGARRTRRFKRRAYRTRKLTRSRSSLSAH